MELKMPGTDLHAELLKTKRKSKAKLNIDIDLSLDFKLDKINSDRIFHTVSYTHLTLPTIWSV